MPEFRHGEKQSGETKKAEIDEVKILPMLQMTGASRLEPWEKRKHTGRDEQRKKKAKLSRLTNQSQKL